MTTDQSELSKIDQVLREWGARVAAGIEVR